MQIGDYQVHALEVGRFALDGGAMFGVVPRTIWERRNPPDALNRIPLALRILLLVSPQRVVLVDTGIGDKFAPRQQEMYAIAPGGGLDAALAGKGLTPADVTDVILTHLHFDHAGGATRYAGENLVPSFPAARYWVQRRNWDWAHSQNERDRASYLPENYAPLEAHGQLRLLDEGGEILPGIHAELSDGHTIGQQLIRVAAGGQQLLYAADILPTSSHLALPFIMGYDLQPLLTLEEKRRLLNQAAAENWLIVFEHDPQMAACRVRQGAKGVELAEAIGDWSSQSTLESR